MDCRTENMDKAGSRGCSGYSSDTDSDVTTYEFDLCPGGTNVSDASVKKGNQATTSEVHSDCDLENALFGSEVAESCQSTKLQDLSGTLVAGSTLEERDVRCAIKTKCGHSVSMRWPEGKSKSISSTEVSSVNAGTGKACKPSFIHQPVRAKRPYVLSHESNSTSVEIPSNINQYLRKYQQEGVSFLYQKYAEGSGGLLLDSEGLGKKVQVIALMASILRKTRAAITTSDTVKGTFLVVCCDTALRKWTSQLELWSHLSHSVYGGDWQSVHEAREGRADVVIVTCESAMTHLEELNTQQWLAVVCDDVLAIKNSSGHGALPLFQEQRRISLMDGSLQINLDQLWCILNWTNPGCLGSHQDFQDEFVGPITKGNDAGSSRRQKMLAEQRKLDLKQLMKRWVLRRQAKDVLEQLPGKDDCVLFCPMTDLQEAIYQQFLSTDDASLILESHNSCDCYSGRERGNCCFKINKDGTSWQSLGYSYTSILTKCANHLGLLLSNMAPSSSKTDEVHVAEVVRNILSMHPRFFCLTKKAAFLTLSDPQHCGKMKVFQNLMENFRRNSSKVAILSDSDMLLDGMENFLVSQGYVYTRLSGNTTESEARTQGAKFNLDSSLSVLLISSKFKGCGLTLYEANRVIIFDPTWSSEAVDEIQKYCIGQSREVKIYRLVSEGTLEEMIFLRHVYKQKLKSSSTESKSTKEDGHKGNLLSTDNLFDFCNLWPLRKTEDEKYLSHVLLKKSYCQEAGVMVMPNVTKETPAAQDMIVEFSGHKACVPSDISEHQTSNISDSLKRSNFSQIKLDISDESDDIDSYQPKKHKEKEKDMLQPSSPSLTCAVSEPPLESPSLENTKPVPKASRPKLLSSNQQQQAKKGQGGSKLTDGKQPKKPAARKLSKSKSAFKDRKSGTARSRTGGKGIHYEDEEGYSPNPTPLTQVQSAEETASTSEISEVSGHGMVSQKAPDASILGSVHTYIEHEMIAELFSPPVISTQQPVTNQLADTLVNKDTPISATQFITTEENTIPVSATQLITTEGNSDTTPANVSSISQKNNVSSTASNEVKPSICPSSNFNIDDLFGF